MKMKIIKKLFLGVFICFIICSFSFSKDFDGVFGMYRLELHENAGTFTLSMLDSDSEKFIPVFNPLDNSSGTLLYLKSGSKVYPLSKLGGVPIIHNMTENSATITYNIKGVAEVNFIFSFVYSATGFFTENSDLVIIDVLVKNLSKKSKILSLRGVFDTYLGENSPIHFTTKTLNLLNSEAYFNSMSIDKWIKSSDGKNSIKFLLEGETITTPEAVMVANRDILSVDSWEPRIVPGRGFNSLFSLNNSAVGITWNAYKVAPEKLFGVRFYISGASDSKEPVDTSCSFFTSGKALQTASFVYDSDKLKAEEVIEYVVLSTNTDVEKDDNKDDNKDNENVSETIEIVPVSEGSESGDDDTLDSDENEFVEETSIIEDSEVVEDEVTSEETDVLDEYTEEPEQNLPYVEITPEKLNLEYVEELIKEIEALEQNPELYDASRILYLHTELDAILEILEQ